MIDLIAAVDAQIGLVEAELIAAAALQDPLLEDIAADQAEWRATSLGDVGEFVRGRRFTKNDYVDVGLGCIHYGQLYTHFGATAKTTLTFVPESMRDRLRLAVPGDVVVAATSENIEDLGSATAWLGEDDVAVHDDCYIYRHTLDPTFAAYVFRSPEFQRSKTQYAAGTKVTRMSGANLAKIKIQVPPRDVQVRVGETLNEIDATVDCARAELDRLRAFRSSLLTSLLNQEIEIPESYDALLERVP